MESATNQRTNAVLQVLAALDFSVENVRITDLEADFGAEERAIAKAEARCTEISRTLIANRGLDARTVADPLADEAEAREAASAGPSEEELQHEGAALPAGIAELHKRNTRTRADIGTIRSTARAQSGCATARLVATMIGEMCALADSHFSAHVTLEPTGVATCSFSIQRGKA